MFTDEIIIAAPLRITDATAGLMGIDKNSPIVAAKRKIGMYFPG